VGLKHLHEIGTRHARHVGFHSKLLAVKCTVAKGSVSRGYEHGWAIPRENFSKWKVAKNDVKNSNEAWAGTRTAMSLAPGMGTITGTRMKTIRWYVLPGWASQVFISCFEQHVLVRELAVKRR
jgi:hypothetical protein